MIQLSLISWDTMTSHDLATLLYQMRNHYYHIRSLRRGRFGQARLRTEYRRVAVLKKKLLLCGFEKREVLDLVACCRLKCCAVSVPFSYCKHCGQGRD